MNKRMRVAVVGAGLCGLTAARGLADAGAEVTVFEKSRGLGGRLATRRRDGLALDHGAPWVHAAGAAFAEALQELGATPLGDGRWVGTPGMSDLARPLAAGLDIRIEVEVEAVVGTDLRRGGETLGSFDRVVVTVPAPQARRLLGDDGAVPAAVVMDPVWTLLCEGAGPAGAPDVLCPASGPIVLALGSGSRPWRTGPDGWVAHARAGWSRARLELTREEVAEDLGAAFADLVGWRPATGAWRAAHRWRFARTATPLGHPFVAHDGGRVLIGGDWALGPDASDAWASGRAMADALLA